MIAAVVHFAACVVATSADLREFTRWLRTTDIDTAAHALNTLLRDVDRSSLSAVQLAAVSSSSSDVAANDSELQALLHVAHLNNGALAGLRSGPLLLEIGANSRDTMDSVLQHLDSNVSLVSFEPLLDKYGYLLSRNTKADTRSPLGFHVKRVPTLLVD